MDFSQFDMRAKAEAGFRLHIRNPETGEPITGDAGPCVVIVRGLASDTVQRAVSKSAADAMSRKIEKKPITPETLNTELNDAAARVIIGFENISIGKRALTNSPDDVAAFLNLTFISLPHLQREDHGLSQREDETAADFALRCDDWVKASRSIWRGASFAQQVLDASRGIAETLGNG